MKPLTLLGLLIYALLVLGLWTVDGGLLALALPLLLYLGAGLLQAPPEPRLQVTRELSADRIMPGMPVVVTLTVANQGARLEEVLLEDLVPPALALVDGESCAFTTLEAGATVELQYTLRGRRGFYHFPGVRVTASDPLGLFRKQVVLPAPGQLFVLPQVVTLRRVAIRPRRTRVYAGMIPARHGGPGVEFFGVRPYQPGDPLRWINSRATARHEEALFVNEFEQERVADVGLILDARARSDVRKQDRSLFEHGVEATAALADALLARGNRVGLLIYGNAVSWTFPGYGKVQRERILRALARAETGDRPAFENLDLIPTRLFPIRSQLVVISPLLSEDVDAIVRLRARGYQLLVVSPDPIPFEQEQLGSGRTVELAARIARLERTLLLRKLRQTGAQVVEWQVGRPFQQVADAALSAPRRGGPQ